LVLLISNYELGHPPHHLTQPLSALEAAGLAARGLDLSVEKLDENAVREARVIGIAAQMHTALRLGLELLPRIRQLNPKAHVVFYGLYAALQQKALLASGADSILGGEMEDALVALSRRVLGGEHFSTTDVPLARLRLPVPRRDGLPQLSRYAKLLAGGRERLVGYTEATRGCKHLCRHCPIPPVYGGRFFAVEADAVIADASAQIAAGAEHITFGDPDFLNGPRHAITVARALHARHPKVSFDFTAKISHLVAHADLLRELAALGALFVTSAVESLAPAVLTALDKGHTAADVDAALAACRTAGLTLRPTFVPFTPWTTLDDHLALFDWMQLHKMFGAVDPIQLALRLLVPNGSLLLDALAPNLVAGDDALSHAWAHPDPRMDTLAAASLATVDELADADPAVIHARLWQLSAETAGQPSRAPSSVEAAPTPRLTESWFCCAEPSARQRSAV
jgi:radical SAM superfamily enzyme YgiQ (UPF0313 family)